MNNTDFFSCFLQTPFDKGVVITNVDETSLNTFREAVTEVKKKVKSSTIRIEYDVMEKNLKYTVV